MELAVNTFTKGLQNDTHPMVQGNDTLSDALNATFITMNGNEVVLLNDMGNRRVDNAFLPAGYEPVGIKEYGGIIYVASYNPITNRSLIGSFPSPERKGKSNDNPKNINFGGFIDERRIDENNLEYLIKTREIINQITDNPLRAGDKFSIYYTNNTNDNSNNTDISILNYIGKNKLFTLNVGILNSLNEFIDITNDLLGNIIEEETNSFNDTIDDNEFMLNRLALAINTYSYKLVSHLYLKTKINTFNSVTWNIDGDKNENGDIILYPSATYVFEDNFEFMDRYNYPSSIKIGNVDIPLEFSEKIEEYPNIITVNYNSITFIKDNNNINNYKISINNNEENITFDDNIISYTIYSYLYHNNFYKDNNDNSINIIVDKFKGEKDISKLNSDTIDFNGWRYYNRENNNITEGTIDINIYAKHKNSRLKSFWAKFTKINSDGSESLTSIKVDLIPDISVNTNRFSFNRTNLGLESRTLYKVKFYYSLEVSENNYNNVEIDNKESLFITTSLFNNNYLGTENFVYNSLYLTLETGISVQEDSIISDLSIINGINYSYHQHQDVYIEDFCKIKKILVYPIVNWNYSNNLNITTNLERNLYDNLNCYITYTDTITNTINLSHNLTIENIELYPNVGTVSGTINSFTLENKTYNGLNNLENLNDSLIENKTENLDVITKSNNETINENSITQIYTVINKIKSVPVNKTITTNNVMTSFYDFIYNNGLINISKPYYCIDNEGGDGYYITYINSENGDPTNNQQYAKGLIGSFDNNGKYHYLNNKQIISDYIISNRNDNSLFVGEYNSNDYLTWYNNGILSSFPCYYLNNNNEIEVPLTDITRRNFKRVWIRVNSYLFIPFILLYAKDGTMDFSDLNSKILLECKRIPHIYAYELKNESFNINILDVNLGYKTKEFNVSVKDLIKYELSGSNINYNYNSKIGIDSDNSNMKYIELLEANLLSNLNFHNFIELLSSYHFDTVYKYNSNNEENYILFDRNGELLDSKYVYKINSGKLEKCYIPDSKFTISNNMYLPNLINNTEYNNSYICMELDEPSGNLGVLTIGRILEFSYIPNIYNI